MEKLFLFQKKIRDAATIGFIFAVFIGAQIFFTEAAEAKVCIWLAEPKTCQFDETELPAAQRPMQEFTAECRRDCAEQDIDCEALPVPLTCAEWESANAAGAGASSQPTIPRSTRPTPEQSGEILSDTLKGDIKKLDKFNGRSLPVILGGMIKIAMGIIGAVALLVFIYGGIIWMLDAGNSDRQKKGFDTLFWGGLGVAVIFASYALVTYVFQAFQ